MQSKLYFLYNSKITRLEFFHSRDYVHRDVKPENLLLGPDKNRDTVYLIDYGLANEYFDKRINLHIRMKNRLGLIGTAKYASINAHNGLEQSRRDDLEAAGYFLIYLHNG